MRVSKDMISPDLRKGYYAGRLIAHLYHHQWFARFALNMARKFMAGKNIDGLVCEQRYIKIPGSASPLRIRIYKPEHVSGPLPAMLYLHGGGYMTNIPEMFAASFSAFIAAHPCIIVAPDYRKSVEAPFPAAFDDCYNTLLWMKENAAALGAVDEQFIVAGDSAGGGLTASVVLKATDTNDVKIAFQIPLYPMIDDRQNTSSCHDSNAPVWDAINNRLGWELYLKGASSPSSPYAAPSRADDYSRLPPTVTFVGSIEAFRDETVSYVERLREHNIPVAFREFEGAFHAFDYFFPKTEIAKQATSFLLQSYKEYVTRYFS